MARPVLCALVLTGCAANGGLIKPGVTGNEVSVTVTNVWNPAQALPIADRYCHQYGKAARLNVAQGYVATFDCIAL